MTQMDKAKFDLPKQREVTQEEMNSLYSVDALYANKFYVAVQPDGMVRIVFGDQAVRPETEQQDQPVFMRQAITMPVGSYLMFAALVNGNIDNARRVMHGIAAQVARTTPSNVNNETKPGVTQ